MKLAAVTALLTLFGVQAVSAVCCFGGFGPNSCSRALADPSLRVRGLDISPDACCCSAPSLSSCGDHCGLVSVPCNLRRPGIRLNRWYSERSYGYQQDSSRQSAALEIISWVYRSDVP